VDHSSSGGHSDSSNTSGGHNTSSFDGWQSGLRLDRRDAVLVAVQQRVVDADVADEANDTDFVFTGRRRAFR
jgi:hypothetical protein